MPTAENALDEALSLSTDAFDFTKAMLDGDEEIIQIITPMFLEGCDKQVEEIQSAIRDKDAELLYRSAHTFKGLVGNFNAKPI